MSVSSAGPSKTPAIIDGHAIKPRKLHLAIIETSVNNHDILAHTLPHNVHHGDEYIIVTAPEDLDTQRVARFFGATCVVTDVMQTHWGEFHKGKGINEGLKACKMKDWILHKDTDIVLPPIFRNYVENAKLDKSMIFGCDRAEFKSYRDWQQFIGNPTLHTDGNANCFIDPLHHGQALGTRLHFGHAGGFIPLGFFQLWNVASGIKEYASGHTDAAREDNEFSMKWQRSKRGFLPEVIVYHLESESAPMGVNWKQRTTKPFQHE